MKFRLEVKPPLLAIADFPWLNSFSLFLTALCHNTYFFLSYRRFVGMPLKIVPIIVYSQCLFLKKPANQSLVIL